MLSAESSELSQREKVRYSRHILLPEVGLEGQLKLRNASVLVIGAGGLGCPALTYLAAAGVGTIGIIDFDKVDLSNLQRQILYEESALGKMKSARAAERLKSINGDIQLRTFEERLNAGNALEVMRDFAVILDGTDNFSTRYLVNDACVMLKKPNVYGSIFRFEGQVSVFAWQDGPCYRCLFPEPPPPETVPNCAEGGVLGVLAGVIGSLQCTEALKIILGRGDTLAGRLLLYDALAMRFTELSLSRDKSCPMCGDNPTIKKLSEQVVSCSSEDELSAKGLQEKLERGGKLVLLDVRTAEERSISSIPSSIHIPLAELPQRNKELGKSDEIVAYCRSGVRSRKAIEILREQGFSKLSNLQGGIIAWQQEMDPNLPIA